MRSLSKSFSKPKVPKEIESISVQQLKEVLKDGFLSQRTVYNTWKKKFFVLTPVGIYRFKSQNATQCKGLIRFTSYTSVSPAQSETKKLFSFQIRYYTSNHTSDARSLCTVFLMADTELDMSSWMSAIYSSLENAEKVTRQSYRFTSMSDESKPRKYRSLVINVAEAKDLSIKQEPESSPELSHHLSPSSSTGSVSSSLGHEPPASNKLLNSYAMIDIGLDQYRTRTARSKTTNPFWGEDFTIDLEEDVDFKGINFTVWCEDKNHRPYIAGRICVDEEQLIENQLNNQWCYLDYASTNDFASGYITIRWTYIEPNLTVRVLEGRNLAMKSAHGSIHVEAAYLTQNHKTQSIRGTRNPFWNEELVFINPYSVPRGLAREFKVTCYDDSLPAGGAGFLGEFTIPMEQLTRSSTKDERFQLQHRHRASSPSGVSFARRSALGSELSSGTRTSFHGPSGRAVITSRSSSSPNLRQGSTPPVSSSPTLSSGIPNFMVGSLSGSNISATVTQGQVAGSRSSIIDSIVTYGESGPTSGSIRLSVKYLVEDILPTGSYKQLQKTLTSHDGIQMSIALGSLVSGITERTQMSTSMVKAYDALGESTTLILALTTHEILSTEDAHVIFRGNFLGSKALDAYMGLIGGHFLHSTLSPIVTKLYEFRKSCEVDPQALKPGKDVNRNIKRLQQVTQDALKAIYNSVDNCPSPLRTVFSTLQRNVTHKFGDLKVRYTVVSGLLFSRLFCVALLSPKLFGLALDHPDAKTERTLKLVAKVIQNIANLVTFEEKEDYMKCMNSFIVDNMASMKSFLENISKATSYFINLDRESACLHAFLRAYKDELCRKYSQTSWLKHVTSILNELDIVSMINDLERKPGEKADNANVH